MPRVPTFEPQVRQAALPGARMSAQTTPDTFGASVGEGVQNVAGAMARVYAEEKQKADQAAIFSATNDFNAAKTKRLLDPETGALNQHGEAAFSQPVAVQDDLTKTAGEIRQRLANDEQRTAFDQTVAGHLQDANETVDRHVAGERQQFYKVTYDTAVSNAKLEAQANKLDPARVQQSLEEQRRARFLQADSLGLKGTGWLESVTAQDTSETHAVNIEAFLAEGNDKTAKSYFDKYGADIVGKDKVAVEKALEVGTIRGDAQRISDQVMLKVSNNEILTLSDALAESRKLSGDDPKLREESDRQTINNYNLQIASDEKRQKDLNLMADEQFTQGNSTKGIDPGLWSRLTSVNQAAFRQREAQIAKGENVPDGSDAYYKARIALMNPETRESAVRMDLRSIRPTMSPRNYNELIDLQGSVGKDIAGDKKRDTEDRQTASFTTREKVASRTLKDLGIAPEEGYSVKGEWQPNTPAIEFRRLLDRTVDAEEAARPDHKILTLEETRKIAVRLAADISIDRPGFFYGVNTTHTAAFQLPKADKQAFRIEEVPQDYREKALKAAGRPVTDAQLIDGYNRWLNLPETPAPDENGSGDFPFMGG